MTGTAAVLVLSLAFASQAPTAEEILAKARKVTGAGAVRSLSITGERRITIVTGGVARMVSREVRMDFLLPDKFLRAERLDLPSGVQGPTMIEAVDGTSVWRDVKDITVLAAPQRQADDARQIRAMFLRYVLLLLQAAPQDAGMRFESDGAWIVDARGPNQFALRMFFDEKTALPMRAEWDEYSLQLSGYARFSGVLLPRWLILSAKGKLAEEFEIKSARINPELKPEQFRK